MTNRGIKTFTLNDFEEQYAPSEQPILEVAVVGDVTFLSIRKLEETYDTSTITTIAEIGVDTASLQVGLAASTMERSS